MLDPQLLCPHNRAQDETPFRALLDIVVSCDCIVSTTHEPICMECTINPRFLFPRDERPAQDFSMPQIAVHAPSETKPQKAAKLWAKMEGHIFNGEPRNPDAGRHTLSAWCATHKGASGTCNTESRLCLFGFVRFSSALCDETDEQSSGKEQNQDSVERRGWRIFERRHRDAVQSIDPSQPRPKSTRR